jgi:small conductance mechanosensitive channel
LSPLIRIPEALLQPQSLIGAVLYAVLLLVLASVLARMLRGTVDRVLARDEHGHIDRTVASFLTQLGQIAIFIVAFTVYAHIIPELQRVGTALLAGVSIASVVIGLAAQNTLGNLIAGLSLLLYRPIRLDDLVQVTTPGGPEIGIVEQLTLGYTLLRTADDRRIVVPNSTMASQVTVNLNTWNLRAMAIVPVGIGGDEDVDEVRHTLLAIGAAHPGVERVIDCPVRPHGESGVVLSLRVWCADSETANQVRRELVDRIRDQLAARAIPATVFTPPKEPARPAASGSG